jgi:ATP-dependent DNA helicase RecQ
MKATKRAARTHSADIQLEQDSDKVLFATLKALRLSIAKGKNIPPYVVFHDKTLIDMILKRPTTLAALSEISGVGHSKLEKYGQAFLDALTREPCLAGSAP